METTIMTERKELATQATKKIIDGLKAQLEVLKDLSIRDIAEAEDNEQLLDVVFKASGVLMKISLSIEEAF